MRELILIHLYNKLNERHQSYLVLIQMMTVVMRKEREVYSVSCIGVLPFIEGSLRDGTSGLVAVSRDSEEHA